MPVPASDRERGHVGARANRVLHAFAVRSTVAAATVDDIDVAEAVLVDRVLAVLTAADLGPVLAAREVAYVGEPVALVVAEDRYAAADAAGLVIVDYDPTEPFVVDADATDLHEEVGPVAAHIIDDGAHGAGDAPAGDHSELVVELHVPRTAPVSPTPVEPEAAPTIDGVELAVPVAPGDTGTFRARVRGALGDVAVELMAIEPETPDVLVDPREAALTVAAARYLDRPVRLMRPRSDELIAGPHHPGHHVRVRVRHAPDGRVAHVAVDHLLDVGSRADVDATDLARRLVAFATTVYEVPAVEWRVRAVRTNTAPTVVDDRALALAASYVLERALDHVAAATGLDALGVRRANATPAADAVLSRLAAAPAPAGEVDDGAPGVGVALVAAPGGRIEAHRCAVTVDRATGSVRIERYEGWGAGDRPDAMARSVAAALYEAIAYDEEGQPRSGTLIDYLVPAASEMPPLHVVGDGAPTVPAPHAVIAGVASAIALSPGADDPLPPLAPARVRALLRNRR